jgi:hypothetical protein
MTVNWLAYTYILRQIKKAGISHRLDRIHKLVAPISNEEKRLDAMFVYEYRHQHFPEDDKDLLRMYGKYIDRLLEDTK